jgi:hypothetical protein
MEGCAATLSAGSAIIVDPADVPHASEYGEAEMEVLLHELKHDVGLYLPAPPAPSAKASQI